MRKPTGLEGTFPCNTAYTMADMDRIRLLVIQGKTMRQIKRKMGLTLDAIYTLKSDNPQAFNGLVREYK